MTTDLPLVQIIIGSVRERRFGAPVARWFADVADARSDLRFEVVDLAAWELPALTTPVPPMMGPSADAAIRRWGAKVAQADGYVLVTPEYNHGYPASLKNALDHLFAEWGRKPVGFVSYGGPGGGLRAVEQLRQVVVELDMVPLRQQVAIPRVYGRLGPAGTLDADDHVGEARALLDALAWWTAALRPARLAAVG
jgi:NAD(P)H-dependent FMN reductase